MAINPWTSPYGTAGMIALPIQKLVSDNSYGLIGVKYTLRTATRAARTNTPHASFGPGASAPGPGGIELDKNPAPCIHPACGKVRGGAAPRVKIILPGETSTA